MAADTVRMLFTAAESDARVPKDANKKKGTLLVCRWRHSLMGDHHGVDASFVSVIHRCAHAMMEGLGGCSACTAKFGEVVSSD
jgi:hypothetical protein